METFDIFRDIAERTGGDIYIGVVGPVRTGKSTFIRRFMELLVLPNIKDPNERERARDALPQGGTGRTIMTTEPKFVPDDGVEVVIRDNISMRVRLVDCVGYGVQGALGYAEEDVPRLVNTPWSEEPMPFEQAAEIGTQKVITDHSTMGILVTTDGSVTDLPRRAYIDAEERVVEELKNLGRPFIVLLNSMHPDESGTRELAAELEHTYDVPVLAVDAARMSLEDTYIIMEELLYEFPVREVTVELPSWVRELDKKHWLRESLEEAAAQAIKGIRRVRDIEPATASLARHERVASCTLRNLDLGTGVAHIEVGTHEEYFLQVLGEIAGQPLEGKEQLLRLLKEWAVAKREYDVVAAGLKEVRETGYGMVPPQISEISFEEPELIRQGGRFGVRLRASAPSIHLIRADVETEVTPFIGAEKQGEEMVRYLLQQFEDDPSKVWESDFFGRSLADIIREGIQSKLYRIPENVQEKLQETVHRIVNEGTGGLICIII